MMNPCNEIAHGPTGPVMPWVQVQWMQFLRYHQGLPPYTPEESKEILDDLENIRLSEEAKK
jgi:hypothetical protein